MEKNSTRFYLVSANIMLAVFAIIFANTGLLPFGTMGDFAFFALLGLALAFYRPSWSFAFFAGSLALESVNLAPVGLGLAMRPYQFFALATLLALAWRFFSKKNALALPRWRWHDAVVAVFALAGFVSAAFADGKGVAFKQALVALSFAALYFLVRIYVRSVDDLKKIAPFFLGTSFVAAAYGIWQNARFMRGLNHFEVMPGRPNATFTEADWLGMFVVFSLSALYAAIYHFHGKKNGKKSLPPLVCHLSAVPFIAVLLLTVARSAWLGAAAAGAVFLCLFALKKDWKNVRDNAAGMAVSIVLSLSLVYGFGLTNFQLGSRAASTGGLQKITISCGGQGGAVPEKIRSVSELAGYGCRHIDLEEIESEKAQGARVLEVFRPDPNVNIRAEIYRKSVAEIKEHPILGIGWGNISGILGEDERGAGLNASNIFLEIWLGAGLVGTLSFAALLGYILVAGLSRFLKRNDAEAVFALLGLLAIAVPNLFNSGIFLGFVWAYLAAAISLLDDKNARQA